MNKFSRILPHVWPHRRKIYLSAVFAVLVAFFWSVNLSAAFPIIKVLLQGQGLGEYVHKEIASAETEVEKRSFSIADIDRRLGRVAEDSPKRVGLLQQRSRHESKLTDATRRLVMMNWLDSHVIWWLPGDQFDLLAAILVVLLTATVLKGLCVFMQDVLIGSAVELTTMSIRKECFRRTLALDYQTVQQNGSSSLMSRFTYDMQLLGQGLTLLGGKVVREPLKAICCIVGAFVVCWQLTLLSLLCVPIVAFVFYRIGRTLKRASHRLMESMSRIYKTLEETLEAIKVVIAFNGQRRHRQRFHRENKQYYRKARKIIQIDALTSPVTEALGMLAVFFALLPGAYLVLRGKTDIWGIRLSSTQMDIAELSVLYVFLAGTIDPIRKLSTTYAKLKRAAAAADRVFELLDQESRVNDPEIPQTMPRHAESIEFRDVWFRYAPRENETLDEATPAVLDEVSLTVRHGEVVVVVGENGSGKSTLVNLLPRYFDPGRGQVLIDGVDIRTVRLRELRRHIGVVTQETLLFDESIAENIRYGRTEASRDEIEAAARRAHVDQFVESLPEGYDTIVGDKGGKLSGGQRQRIALARAILRDPAILILDEATSAIDANSEQLIHSALREFAGGRTAFIITHSVSPGILDFVSRIAVMDRGKLIAAGPHADLLQTCPVYQSLFQAQTEQRSGDSRAA